MTEQRERELNKNSQGNYAGTLKRSKETKEKKMYKWKGVFGELTYI